MRRYDPARKLLKLPAPPRPQSMAQYRFYPYPGSCNADEGLGPAAADSLELRSVPWVWALCRHSLSSLLNKRNKQREILKQRQPLPCLAWGAGVLCSLPTGSVDEHPAHAELAGDADSLGAAIVQNPMQNSNCGWLLVLGSFWARENSSWEPKEIGNLEVQYLLSWPLLPFSASPVLISAPVTSSSAPQISTGFHSRKDGVGGECAMCRLDEIHSPNAFIVGFTLLAKLTFLSKERAHVRCQEIEIYILL